MDRWAQFAATSVRADQARWAAMPAAERAQHAWELYRAVAAHLDPEQVARDLSERREAEIAAIRRLRAGARRAQ